MPHVEASGGKPVLDQLTQNDSWIKTTYFLVEEASRQLGNPRISRDVISQASKLQQDVLLCLPHEGDSARPVSPVKVRNLYDFISRNRKGLIVMRHGKQYIEQEERKILAGSKRKINLMQLPFNDEDPAEAQSLAEAAGLAVVVKDIVERLKLPVNILTSRNARAADIAAIVSIANGLNISIDDRLTCVNYPGDVSDEDLIGKIGENNNGALIWDKRIVDSVCGDGTYAQISRNMSDLVHESSQKPGITICLTHTPQMNAVDILANDSPVRVPELGFRVFSGSRSLQFPNSIFED